MEGRDLMESIHMTQRKSLGRGRGKGNIDMEKVYRQIDSGRTVESVAAEWGVSASTLYRRHRAYQKEIELVYRAETERQLPPLPEDLMD